VKGSRFPSLNLDGFFLPLFPLERGIPVEVFKYSKIKYKPAFQASYVLHANVIFPLLFVLLLFPVQVEKSFAEPDMRPKRILSMSPGITEILFSIGAGDRVVGVTDFCEYPAEATKLPSVGGMLNPSFETIITLQPDLIIHQKGSQEVNKFAHRLGIKTLDVPMLSLEEIFAGIPIIGKHIGFSYEAEKLVEELKEALTGSEKSEEIQNQIDLLEKELKGIQDAELSEYRDEITNEIRKELAGRISGRDGRIKESLKNDKQFAVALDIIEQQSVYSHLLAFGE